MCSSKSSCGRIAKVEVEFRISLKAPSLRLLHPCVISQAPSSPLPPKISTSQGLWIANCSTISGTRIPQDDDTSGFEGSQPAVEEDDAFSGNGSIYSTVRELPPEQSPELARPQRHNKRPQLLSQDVSIRPILPCTYS